MLFEQGTLLLAELVAFLGKDAVLALFPSSWADKAPDRANLAVRYMCWAAIASCGLMVGLGFFVLFRLFNHRLGWPFRLEFHSGQRQSRSPHEEKGVCRELEDGLLPTGVSKADPFKEKELALFVATPAGSASAIATPAAGGSETATSIKSLDHKPQLDHRNRYKNSPPSSSTTPSSYPLSPPTPMSSSPPSPPPDGADGGPPGVDGPRRSTPMIEIVPPNKEYNYFRHSHPGRELGTGLLDIETDVVGLATGFLTFAAVCAGLYGEEWREIVEVGRDTRMGWTAEGMLVLGLCAVAIVLVSGFQVVVEERLLCGGGYGRCWGGSAPEAQPQDSRPDLSRIVPTDDSDISAADVDAEDLQTTVTTRNFFPTVLRAQNCTLGFFCGFLLNLFWKSILTSPGLRDLHVFGSELTWGQLLYPVLMFHIGRGIMFRLEKKMTEEAEAEEVLVNGAARSVEETGTTSEVPVSVSSAEQAGGIRGTRAAGSEDTGGSIGATHDRSGGPATTTGPSSRSRRLARARTISRLWRARTHELWRLAYQTCIALACEGVLEVLVDSVAKTETETASVARLKSVLQVGVAVLLLLVWVGMCFFGAYLRTTHCFIQGHLFIHHSNAQL